MLCNIYGYVSHDLPCSNLCPTDWTASIPNDILQAIPTFQSTAATSLSSATLTVMSSVEQPPLADSSKAQQTLVNYYP